MKSVYYVIRDCGDGSQNIEWHKTMSQEKEDKLVENDKYDSYASGDGFQCTELKFPDDFDIEEFAKVNHIYWFEDEQESEFDIEP